MEWCRRMHGSEELQLRILELWSGLAEYKGVRNYDLGSSNCGMVSQNARE